MNFAYYPNKPAQQIPIHLPPSLCSIEACPEQYSPDEGLEGAVNVALLLGQPLLLTGEPGTGKTQLAYHLGYVLNLEVLKFEAKSTSTARDLFYFYDALGRFHDAQASQLGERPQRKHSADYLTYNALGEAILRANPPQDLKLPENFVLGEPRRSIVLIDEIDKAPRDFPNDILNEVEQMYFRIPELDNVKIEADINMRPILIMTSNSEKHLPDAFLRRCIYYDIPFPDDDRLKEIIEKHLGELQSPLLKEALGFFKELRENQQLRKKPSTAELLNWLVVLRNLFPKSDNPLQEYPQRVSLTLSSVVKTKVDQDKAKEAFEDKYMR